MTLLHLYLAELAGDVCAGTLLKFFFHNKENKKRYYQFVRRACIENADDLIIFRKLYNKKLT